MLLWIAAIFVGLAITLQWRDCVRDYGNTPGAENLVRSLWLVAAILLGVAFGRAHHWLLGVGVAFVIFALSYPIYARIQALGRRFGPRG